MERTGRAKAALITGASGGIGLGLAHEFARNKINLVLTARSEAKLQGIAADLRSKYGIQVRVIAKDLSAREASEQLYQEVMQNGLTIDYLVNNAGFGDFGMFHERPWDKLEMMIDLNVKGLTHLTHLFLPGMISRRSGRIMNVASTASFEPGPLMAVYYATKAYVLHFSEAIGNELASQGITVTALCPGPTTSGFQETAAMEESGLVRGKKLPTADEVARYGYKAMMRGRKVAIHGLKNKLMVFSVRVSPRQLVTRVVRWMSEKEGRR